MSLKLFGRWSRERAADREDQKRRHLGFSVLIVTWSMVQRESGGQRGPVKTPFRVGCLYSYLVHGPERESGQRGTVKTTFRICCLYSYLVHSPERERTERNSKDDV